MVLSTCHDSDHLSLLTVQSGGVEALTDLYHRGCVGHPGLDHIPELPPPDNNTSLCPKFPMVFDKVKPLNLRTVSNLFDSMSINT